MNKQEAFNKAYIGIVKQGRPSIDENDICAYRGPYGAKCAIGHLIADEDYDECIENTRVDYDLITKCRLPKDTDFLLSLQAAHDDTTDEDNKDFVIKFKAYMKQIAWRYDLTIPEVE